MSVVLSQTGSGHELAGRDFERGREQGLLDVMWALLRARFGDRDDLDNLARRLACHDYDGNIARIVAGATLAELWYLSCGYIAQSAPIELRQTEGPRH